MSVTPPETRIWWNEPIHKVELGWIVIAFLWGLFMFFFMIAWHFIGNQNLSTETYRILPSAYEMFQEGLRIPPKKLFKRGVVQEDVKDFLLVNVRIPPAYAGLGEIVSVLPVIFAAMTMLLKKIKVDVDAVAAA